MLKDEINYLIFGEIYFRFSDPGARRKAFAILEAAIVCLDRKGFGGVTLEMIAREAGITRPLIKHYFADLDDLCGTAVKYIRLRFQKMVVDEVSNQTTEVLKLVRYIDTCFEWIDKFRSHANVWLSFLSQCVRKPSLRKLNTTAVETGEERIVGLLRLGQKNNVFHFKSVEGTAKALQSLLTGALVTYSSEDLRDAKEYKKAILSHGLQLVGVKE